MTRLDPDTLLLAYAQGLFPMGEGRAIRWYTADPRGVIPLDDFHVPHNLAQLVRRGAYEIRINSAFAEVMRGCMKSRSRTWINAGILRAYVRLHEMGIAHSVEAWQGGELAGGLYGLSLGAAFVGESMFHRRPNASKVALVALVDRLVSRGYELLDAQVSTPHLQQFGCIEIPAADYLIKLEKAMRRECRFFP